MEALKVIHSTQNGILQILVPDNFNNTPLEIIITPLKDKAVSSKESLQSVKKYFGTAKFPNTVVNKYDACDQ